MSSPLDREFGQDDPSPFAPRRVRSHSSDETFGPGSEEPGEQVNKRARTARDAAPEDEEGGLVIERYRVPRSLDPTLASRDELVPRSRFDLGMFGRLSIAALVAAVIAVFAVARGPAPAVVNADERGAGEGTTYVATASRSEVVTTPPAPAPRLLVSLPAIATMDQSATLGISLTNGGEGTKVVVSGVAAGSMISPGRPTGPNSWELERADLGGAVISPPNGFVGAMDVAVALQIADGTIVDRKTLHFIWRQPEQTRAASAAPAAPSAAPTAPNAVVQRRLKPDEIASLLARGQQFIEKGDLAAARSVLQRAAEAGEARAALTLAGTYDPAVLEKMGEQGFASDIGQARIWYERAKQLGSIEAERRLQMLASGNN